MRYFDWQSDSCYHLVVFMSPLHTYLSQPKKNHIQNELWWRSVILSCYQIITVNKNVTNHQNEIDSHVVTLLIDILTLWPRLWHFVMCRQVRIQLRLQIVNKLSSNEIRTIAMSWIVFFFILSWLICFKCSLAFKVFLWTIVDNKFHHIYKKIIFT